MTHAATVAAGHPETVAAAREILREGGTVIYLDFEDTFDPGWAKVLGMDISEGNFILVRPRHREAGFKIIETALEKDKNKEIGMIIWDSLGGSSTKEIVDEKDIEKQAMGLRTAAVLTKLIDRLDARMKDFPTDACIVFINQIRMTMNGPFVSKNTPGGFKFKHAMSMRIGLTTTERLTVDETDPFTNKTTKKEIGARINIKMEKTKFGSRGAIVPLIFKNNLGFDIVASICETATAQNFFDPGGGYWVEIQDEYTGEGMKRVNGKGQVTTYFRQNPEAFGRLQDKVMAMLHENRREQLMKDRNSFHAEDDIVAHSTGESTGDIE